MIDEDTVSPMSFLINLPEKRLYQCYCSRREQQDMRQCVCFGIDRILQSLLLVVDPNHGLVERSVMRRSPVGGL